MVGSVVTDVEGDVFEGRGERLAGCLFVVDDFVGGPGFEGRNPALIQLLDRRDGQGWGRDGRERLTFQPRHPDHLRPEDVGHDLAIEVGDFGFVEELNPLEIGPAVVLKLPDELRIGHFFETTSSQSSLDWTRASALSDLFCQPDEDSFWAVDVAEPVDVFVIHHLANQLRAVWFELFEDRVEVVHVEHHAEVAEGVDGRSSVVFDDGGAVELAEFQAAMAVRCDHHRDFDRLIPQPCDAPGPLAFHHHSALQSHPESFEEGNRGVEGLHRDAGVVHDWLHGVILPNG